eukprot:754606-Amphidinium_carterae.1
MAEAGCFKTVVNDVEIPFGSLELLLTHMARAESYVLRYSAHMPEHAILSQLRIIDEAIRN